MRSWTPTFSKTFSVSVGPCTPFRKSEHEESGLKPLSSPPVYCIFRSRILRPSSAPKVPAASISLSKWQYVIIQFLWTHFWPLQFILSMLGRGRSLQEKAMPSNAFRIKTDILSWPTQPTSAASSLQSYTLWYINHTGLAFPPASPAPPQVNTFRRAHFLCKRCFLPRLNLLSQFPSSFQYQQNCTSSPHTNHHTIPRLNQNPPLWNWRKRLKVQLLKSRTKPCRIWHTLVKT